MICASWQVIELLHEHGLPVDPCLRAVDVAGYTALHWGAIMGNHEILYSLLAHVDRPLHKWKQCRARQCGKTPAEVMQVAFPGFELLEEVLQSWEEETLPAKKCGISSEGIDTLSSGDWGVRRELAKKGQNEGLVLLGYAVIAALQGRSHGAKISILIVYLAGVLQLGWREPRTWVALGIVLWCCSFWSRTYTL